MKKLMIIMLFVLGLPTQQQAAASRTLAQKARVLWNGRLQ